MSSPDEKPSIEELLALLKSLEARIARLEEHLGLAPQEEPQPRANAEEREEALELQIGQNYFARAGIVGIVLGVAFLLTFPYGDIPPAIPSLTGYLLVGLFFFLSHIWRKSYEQVSRYLVGGGMLLLYFTTLRLSYFSPHPALSAGPLDSAFLGAVVVIDLAIALRRSSPSLTVLSLSLGILTALLEGGTAVVGLSLTLLAGVAAYTFLHHRWLGVLIFAAVMTPLGHLIWAFNDPLKGNVLRFTGTPEWAIAFTLVYFLIFAMAALARSDTAQESTGYGVVAAVNGGGALLLLILLTASGVHAHIAPWNAGFGILSLSLAVAFWLRFRSPYSTFVYAMIGYTALGVSILSTFPAPNYFIWLCWETVLVVITAVWFRSRFIVVGNFFIYVLVFFAYLLSAGRVSLVSLSFGLAALLSARILNWKKERLALKTEMMRNAYLGGALFVIPYTLYHSVPAGFVSLSWLLTALCYYLFSRLLGSKKYRWMALLTTIMTILYVFVVDLVRIDPLYRIISFLALGTALLLVSMIYSRRRGARERPPED